jgi:exodeoxyribonuclease-3
MAASLTLITWNVNSVRARLDHVLTYLAEHDADVVCLQETKVEDRLFPRVDFMELGYTVTTHGSKGYAGVATLSKSAPDEVREGFRDGPRDEQCRILNTVVEGVRIYNLYVPNGKAVGSEAFAYKLRWLGRLRDELAAHESDAGEVILCGDFNIAPDDRDVYDAEGMRGELHFSDEEHAALGELLAFGLFDCFRARCSEPGHYSWYDYRGNMFARGLGMRIDHIYATRSLVDRLEGVSHDLEPRGWDSPSDHLPVTARFALETRAV